jgi:H+-transporting ATPase
MIVLVILSLTLSLIAFFYLLGHKENARDALSFTVVLIVASIPVAIEIVR